jgi:D-serine deaminase-like pyridoxal phosphate-dependent protein
MDKIDKIGQIDTPALLIEKSVLEENIRGMQEFADKHHIGLRPHIKTHRSCQLAKTQLEAGAVGIAVAKLAEAEVMAAHGINDIQIANQVVGDIKLARLLELSSKAHLTVAVDSLPNANELHSLFSFHSSRIDVLIEVDTGLHRCGLKSIAAVRELSWEILKLKGLNLRGIMTHAGHAYAAADKDEVAMIGRAEGQLMVEIADTLRSEGLTLDVVSVGSTPTARHCGAVKGVTELRVGNYIFNDMLQVDLGIADISACALTVLATVISKQNNRVVIDAGSKALALDRGAHGSELVKGYGSIIGDHRRISRLSEEHGIIDDAGSDFAVGEQMRIIPNHACPVMNLFEQAYLVDGYNAVDIIYINARGKST